jgi:hypothetical protein
VRRALHDRRPAGPEIAETARYHDLDGARDRLRERQATELPMANAMLAEAERGVAAAEARIARVDRGWQDGVLSDAKHQRQSAALEDELAGAREAVEQARCRVEEITETGAATDAEEALLAQLADLRALVSGIVDQARDIESLRTLVRQLFRADHPAVLEVGGPGRDRGCRGRRRGGAVPGPGLACGRCRLVEHAAHDQPGAAARRCDPSDVSEEGDAALAGPADDRLRGRLVERPRAIGVVAVAHHPQAHARDLQAGGAESDLIHRRILSSG